MVSRIALVTGASSGIGEATALALAARGWRVYAGSRHPHAAHDGIVPLFLDVTDESSVRAAVGQLMSAENQLNAIVNSAGCSIAGPVEDTAMNEAEHQMDVNFLGSVRVIRAALPTMREQRAGIIVNVSSLAGVFGLPFQAFYSASKFALEEFTEVLRHEVKPFGIHIALVEPGDFRTGLTDARVRVAASGPLHARF
jgi:NAD(P)-dependent dehydrogenase (short-subunit alcohol dehydrogenase family)